MAKVKVSDLRSKLNNIRRYLNAVVLEREVEIDSSLISILSGASCVLIGDAGAGKTYHIELLCELFNLKLFDILISPGTKPESVFGPLDVPALAKGVQRIDTTGYAPEADILFFDEIFKAPDPVLNPFLGIMNERKFRNGKDIQKCPTLAIFGASNEVPNTKESRPFYDRWIIRQDVQYIKSQKNLHKLLDIFQNGHGVRKPEPMTRKEILLLRRLVLKVTMTHEVWETAIRIRDTVQNAVGVVVSDRRMGWAVSVAKAHAFLHGRKNVEVQDLEVLSYLFWDQIEQSKKVRSLVLSLCNAEKGDVLTYSETADSIYETALKTGNFEAALSKLKELSKITKQMLDSTVGKKVHSVVISHIRSIRSTLESRAELVVFAMTSSDGQNYVKLSEVSAGLWTEKQLRSVGFKWKRVGYWWKPLKSQSTYLAFTKLVNAKLKAKVVKRGFAA